MKKPVRPIWFAAIAIAVIVIGLLATWISRPDHSTKPDPPHSRTPVGAIDHPIEVAGNGYVGSDECQSCHTEHYDSWHDSYHRTMTQVAGPESVVGDFDNVQLDLFGQIFQLQRRGDEYWVEMPEIAAEGPEANPHNRVQRQIVQVTGSHHMQAYWYPSGESRSLGMLPFIYLIDDGKWVPDTASFIVPPPDGPALPSPGAWNHSCVLCHSTGPRPNYKWAATENPRAVHAQRVETEVAEFGISCEACHGPGEYHVRGHTERPNGLSKAEISLVVPDQLDPHLSSQVCGHCHSVTEFKSDADFVDWSQHGFKFRPGDDIERSARWVLRASSDRPEVRRELQHYPAESIVWPDGMIRVSGREYNGLIESPCFTHDQHSKKLSCFSCHTMHAAGMENREQENWVEDQLKPGMRTKAACTQCHPTHSDKDKLTSHTHHAADSTGSNCLNCHMSYSTYGLLKAIRSHRIDTPSVQTSLATGRLNACNQCHLNQTLSWAGEHLQRWYGIESPQLSKDQETIAASVLWTLKGDAGQRALMAWSMGWPAAREVSGSDWMTPYLGHLMSDPYRAVSIIAYRSLRKQQGFEEFPFDPVAHRSMQQQPLQQLARRYELLTQERKVATPGPRVLMDSSGKLDEVNYRRLLRQRNDRPVQLSE
jgi:hypothetical protein